MARRKARRGYGQGAVEQATNGTWRIRWRENGQRRRAAGFPTRDAAERVLATVLGRVAQDRAGMPADLRGVPTLGALSANWLKRRELTHRAAKDDRRRWDKHLAPHFAHLKPADVSHAAIRRFVEDRLAAGLAPGTVGVCVHNLSAFLADLVEQGLAPTNVCRTLPRGTRALFKSDHNPEDTPFVDKRDDIRRIYLALPEPVSVAYALGAMAGLRTGEIIALRWDSVDLAARRITVRAAADRLTGEERATKDGDVRVVPILHGLLPVLTAWKLKSGGRGLVVPPMQKGAGHISRDVLWEALRSALKALGFPEAAWTPGKDQTLTWYCATRHTFASHWVLAGGSLATLARILGHASVTITERHYVHLRPDAYTDRDLAGIALDLTPSEADLGAVGPRTTHAAPATAANDS
jgi:integrase